MSAENITAEVCLLEEIRDLQITNESRNDSFNQKLVSNLTPICQESFCYNINPRIASTTLVGSGTATIYQSTALLSSNLTINSSSTLSSIKRVQYRYGQGILARFTALWGPRYINTESSIGIGFDGDQFTFGYNGTTFGIRWINSVSGLPITTFIPNSHWDNPESINTSIFNCYEIQFVSKCVNFYVNNQLVHRINDDGIRMMLSIKNLPFYANVKNLSTTNDVYAQVGDFGLFNEGENRITGVVNSVAGVRVNIGAGAPINIVSIRNLATYAGKTNTNLVYPRLILTTGLQIPQFMIVRLRIYTTLDGSETWNQIANSCVEWSNNGNFVSTGEILMEQRLSAENHLEIDISNLNIVLQPNVIMSITAQTTGGNGNVAGSLTFICDI